MKQNEIKQFIRYIIVGGLTTLINYIAYYILINAHQGYLLANTMAWLLAVIFAFYSNRKLVFQSKQNAKQEAFSFFLLRLATLLIENILLYILIQQFTVHVYLAKIIVSFVTIVANYGLCKFKIFNQKEGVIYE
ncbi:MAG: GtrA family protein [Erysipelotrichia bacterium]|nr:GtrA family protein [Erysipelotrichia bacterium]